MKKYIFILILIGCLPHKSVAFSTFSQDTITNKWGLGFVIGIKKIEKHHIALNQCIDSYICGFRPNTFIYQNSPILALELFKTVSSKGQYFLGLEASQQVGFVDGFVYNDNGYVKQLDDFSKTNYFSSSVYGGFRRFIYQNKYCTPFFGLRIILGYHYNNMISTDDITFTSTYLLSDKNIHSNINFHFGALTFQQKLRINIEFPILNITQISNIYKNNEKYQTLIPGNMDIKRLDLWQINFSYNFNV
jgi:hypothetical protein